MRHIAHRGGSREAPENTIHAFRRAVRAGADMLEMDLRATGDGEVVVLHDPIVDRVTEGCGEIACLRLEEVRSLDAAHWFAPGSGPDPAAAVHPLRGVAGGGRAAPHGVDPQELRIPTFREVLAALPGVGLTVDLKVGAPELPWFAEAVADLLEQFDRMPPGGEAVGRRGGEVIVGSFSDDRLGAFRRRAPEASTSATQAEVVRFWTGGVLDVAGLSALQVPAMFGEIEVVTPDFVSRAHDAGLEVHVWTVDEPAEMRRLLALGVDGILTDRPTVLADVLGEGAE